MARSARYGLLAGALIAVLGFGVAVLAHAWRPVAPVAVRHVAASVAPAQPVLLPEVSDVPIIDLDADIGSLVVVSEGGTEISPELRSLLVDGQVGGVLLFSRNFDGPAGLRSWADQLQAIAQQQCMAHPILLMIDQEGGRVDRVTGQYAGPSQLEAAAGGASGVRAVEARTGAGIRSLGVGLDLAPVADVRYNPNDAVIGDRSFGSNPAIVAPLVAAAVAGLHDGGVGATLKHFPGLGGAAGDPHVAIPTDPESMAKWEQIQAPSFRSGIEAGADVVMTTAVYVPGLGGGSTPALFSAPVVSLLRTQLGFKGVILTDALDMGGISDLYSLSDATALALGAGNDLVLLGRGDPNVEAGAMSAIRDAVSSGRLDPLALHQSAVRVNALRDKWGPKIAICRHSQA